MKDFPRSLGYLLPLLLPILWLTGHYLGGGWNYLVVIAAFGVLPVLDALIGIDPKNYDPETERHLSEAPYYRLILYSWTFIQLALLVWALLSRNFRPPFAQRVDRLPPISYDYLRGHWHHRGA
jgi:hypothetical protein